MPICQSYLISIVHPGDHDPILKRGGRFCVCVFGVIPKAIPKEELEQVLRQSLHQE